MALDIQCQTLKENEKQRHNKFVKVGLIYLFFFGFLCITQHQSVTEIHGILKKRKEEKIIENLYLLEDLSSVVIVLENLTYLFLHFADVMYFFFLFFFVVLKF